VRQAEADQGLRRGSRCSARLPEVEDARSDGSGAFSARCRGGTPSQRDTRADDKAGAAGADDQSGRSPERVQSYSGLLFVGERPDSARALCESGFRQLAAPRPPAFPRQPSAMRTPGQVWLDGLVASILGPFDRARDVHPRRRVELAQRCPHVGYDRCIDAPEAWRRSRDLCDGQPLPSARSPSSSQHYVSVGRRGSYPPGHGLELNSTGGSSRTCCFVSSTRISLRTRDVPPIGIATCLRPHRCPSSSSTCVT
jgi:hypothetical protein